MDVNFLFPLISLFYMRLKECRVFLTTLLTNKCMQKMGYSFCITSWLATSLQGLGGREGSNFLSQGLWVSLTKYLKTTKGSLFILSKEQSPICSAFTKILSFKQTDRQTDGHKDIWTDRHCFTLNYKYTCYVSNTCMCQSVYFFSFDLVQFTVNCCQNRELKQKNIQVNNFKKLIIEENYCNPFV